MLLLSAGAVGVYIVYTIMRYNTVGLQDMEITHCDSIFWCDEGCNGRFMGCRVVLTSRNLFIFGRSHHSSGHSKFRDIYLGISVRQALKGV